MNNLPDLDPKTRKSNRRLAVFLAIVAIAFYLVMIMASQR
jgi:hypothetical protein